MLQRTKGKADLHPAFRACHGSEETLKKTYFKKARGTTWIGLTVAIPNSVCETRVLSKITGEEK